MTVAVLGNNTGNAPQGCDSTIFYLTVPNTPQYPASTIDVIKWYTDLTLSVFKFTGLGSLGAVTVTDAKLRFYYSSANIIGKTFLINRLLKPWVAAEATWNNYAAGLPWTTPGAMGVGTDKAAAATYEAAVAQIGGYQEFTSAQLIADVQDMITNGNNFGWWWGFTDWVNPPDQIFYQYVSETSTNGQRPELEITYTAGGASITGGLAATEARDVAVFAGNKTHFGTFAVVDKIDLAAFNGTAIRLSNGQFAVTELRDTAAFAGNSTLPGSVVGGLAATEARDVAAFAGNKTYFGTFAPVEIRDIAAFNGTAIRLSSGQFAVTEAQDIARFSSAVPAGIGGIVIRDGNTGIAASPQSQWKSGAPRGNDGTNLPVALGQVAKTENFGIRTTALNQAQLVQAPADTLSNTDVIPGWYSLVDCKAGEWVWCLSRTVQVTDKDNPIGQGDVP